MPRSRRAPLLAFALVTLATLLLAFYLWRPILGDDLFGPPRPRPAAPIPRYTPAPSRLLATTLPALHLDGVRLEDAVDRIQDASSIPIEVKWWSLEQPTVYNLPVSLHTPASSRLDLVLRALLDKVEAARPGWRLTYDTLGPRHDGDRLVITNEIPLTAPRPVIRGYDVNDIVDPAIAAVRPYMVPGARSFPSPSVFTRWHIDTLFLPGPTDVPSRRAALQATLPHGPYADDRQNFGRTAGDLRVIADRNFLITQTPDHHADIAYHLARRRWQTALAIVAARTLVLLSTTLLATALALTLLRLARRRPADTLCPNCGYDCRATPDRCPECGTPATISTAL